MLGSQGTAAVSSMVEYSTVDAPDVSPVRVSVMVAAREAMFR
jgi:hypothetical protein